MVRVPGTEDLPAHLTTRWHSGLYRGRRADSDEHLVVTSDAIRASRAVRAVEKIDEQLVNDISGQTAKIQPRVATGIAEKVEKSDRPEKPPQELAKAEKVKRSAEESSDK
eukprot:10462416-Heterocapsa_arctica.AAC.1